MSPLDIGVELSRNVLTPLPAGENIGGGGVQAPAGRCPARGDALQGRSLSAAVIVGQRAPRAEQASGLGRRGGGGVAGSAGGAGSQRAADDRRDGPQEEHPEKNECDQRMPEQEINPIRSNEFHDSGRCGKWHMRREWRGCEFVT